jgi:hypothetical protein
MVVTPLGYGVMVLVEGVAEAVDHGHNSGTNDADDTEHTRANQHQYAELRACQKKKQQIEDVNHGGYSCGLWVGESAIKNPAASGVGGYSVG